MISVLDNLIVCHILVFLSFLLVLTMLAPQLWYCFCFHLCYSALRPWLPLLPLYLLLEWTLKGVPILLLGSQAFPHNVALLLP